MRKTFILLGIAAVAYLTYTFGAKAGRGRYREIKAATHAVWNDPKVKRARRQATKRATAASKSAGKRTKHLGR